MQTKRGGAETQRRDAEECISVRSILRVGPLGIKGAGGVRMQVKRRRRGDAEKRRRGMH